MPTAARPAHATPRVLHAYFWSECTVRPRWVPSSAPSSRVPQPNDSSTFYVTARQESRVGLGFKKRRIRNWRQQRREQRRPAGPRPSGRSIFAYHLGLLSIMTKSYPRAEIYDHCPGSSGKMLWVAVHHKSYCSSLLFFSPKPTIHVDSNSV